MPLYDQVDLLCQAVLAQGREEAEKIFKQARSQADRLEALACWFTTRRNVAAWIANVHGYLQWDLGLVGYLDIGRASFRERAKISLVPE